MTTRRGEKEEFFQKIAPLTVQPSTMGIHKDIGSNSATLWQNGYVVRKIPYVFLFDSLFVSLFFCLSVCLSVCSSVCQSV